VNPTIRKLGGIGLLELGANGVVNRISVPLPVILLNLKIVPARPNHHTCERRVRRTLQIKSVVGREIADDVLGLVPAKHLRHPGLRPLLVDPRMTTSAGISSPRS
jgi:hypothetical protein